MQVDFIFYVQFSFYTVIFFNVIIIILAFIAI